MSLFAQEFVATLVLFTFAALALMVMRDRGCFRADAFAQAPNRQTGLVLFDLFIGVWILVLFSMAVRPVLELLEVVAFEDNRPVLPLLPRQVAIMSIVGVILTQVPVCVFIIVRVSQVTLGLRELGLVPRRLGRDLAAGLLAFPAAMVIVLATSWIFSVLSEIAGQPAPAVGHDMLKALLDSTDPVATAIMVVSAVVLAPVFEEIIFRGLMQSALLTTLGGGQRWLTILLASLFFAIVHGGVATWQVMPGLFILGVMLGWLYERHGSLWPCIVLHALFNLGNIGLGIITTRQ